MSEEVSEWIELTEGKQFSRLLYPNPVCFLATSGTTVSKESTAIPVRQDESLRDNQEQQPDCSATGRNVMVVSWLTATNNHGRFVFSLNRHRHSATILRTCYSSRNDKETRFSLSVPVKGMEELVLAVGGISGRWTDKFPSDSSLTVSDCTTARHDPTEPDKVILPLKHTEVADGIQETKRKRKRKSHYPLGIPGLAAMALGDGQFSNGQDESSLFAVRGTVAHMECKVHQMLDDPDLVDADHYLVSAEITKAYVRSTHWNAHKNQFQPQGDAAPFLSFLGSQTFGHVQCD